MPRWRMEGGGDARSGAIASTYGGCTRHSSRRRPHTTAHRAHATFVSHSTEFARLTPRSQPPGANADFRNRPDESVRAALCSRDDPISRC